MHVAPGADDLLYRVKCLFQCRYFNVPVVPPWLMRLCSFRSMRSRSTPFVLMTQPFSRFVSSPTSVFGMDPNISFLAPTVGKEHSGAGADQRGPRKTAKPAGQLTRRRLHWGLCWWLGARHATWLSPVTVRRSLGAGCGVFYVNLQSLEKGVLGLCERIVRNTLRGSPACSATLQTSSPGSMHLCAPRACS
jgi:hypothetical protein